MLLVPRFCKVLTLSQTLKCSTQQVLRVIGRRHARKIECKFLSGDYVFSQEREVVIPFEDSQRVAESLGKTIELQELEPRIPEVKVSSRVGGKYRRPSAVLLGHFDHGKTTLLDSLLGRGSNIQANEPHGITQEIRVTDLPLGNLVVFDTPGQSIFMRMRSHGAGLADMAILLVAADEGLCSQTLESIECIEELELPVIVAINKIDLATSPEAVQELKNNLRQSFPVLKYAPIQEISAKKRMGLDEFKQAVLKQVRKIKLPLQQDLEKFHGFGTVVDITKSQARGTHILVYMHTGMVKANNYLLVGGGVVRVRSVHNAMTYMPIKKAMAGDAVRLQCEHSAKLQGAGNEVFILTKNEADKIARQREMEAALHQHSATMVEEEDDDEVDIPNSSVKLVNIIIKAGTSNMLETLIDEVKYKGLPYNVVQAGVGPIGLNDVDLAFESNSLLLSLGVRWDSNARKMARERKSIKSVEFKTADHLIEHLEALLVH